MIIDTDRLLEALKGYKQTEIVRGTGLSRPTVKNFLSQGADNFRLKTIRQLQEFIDSQSGNTSQGCADAGGFTAEGGETPPPAAPTSGW